jgi:hypothetical protein
MVAPPDDLVTLIPIRWPAVQQVVQRYGMDDVTLKDLAAAVATEAPGARWLVTLLARALPAQVPAVEGALRQLDTLYSNGQRSSTL